VYSSIIITLFVLGLKRVRKIKGNTPKYLILFTLALICPPICIYIIKDDLDPDSWFKTIINVLSCNYCCGYCDPNTALIRYFMHPAIFLVLYLFQLISFY
jgi:hypothetical protein